MMTDWDYHERNVKRHAQRESDAAAARLLGMKIRLRLHGGPSPATGGFPYNRRSVRQIERMAGRA